MKILFYSDKCEFCNKIFVYLDKYNIRNLFKLVNIDNISIPKEIDIIPTIIDEELNQPLKGKKAFEYLINIKYFNNPTNNIDYIKDLPSNPEIKEDDKAVQSKLSNLELDLENSFTKQDVVVKEKPVENKLSILMKLRKR